VKNDENGAEMADFKRKMTKKGEPMTSLSLLILRSL